MAPDDDFDPEAQIMSFKNESSWGDVKFYDHTNYSNNLEHWLTENKPSEYIHESVCKTLAVLHPTIDVTAFKRSHDRQTSISADMNDEIILNKCRITHTQLLAMAERCEILDGFWFFFCSDECTGTEKLWDAYFKKIVLGMRQKANELRQVDQALSFVKIEACWNSIRSMGMITISNDSFQQKNVIEDVGMSFRQLINQLDVENGVVSNLLCYKPRFYFDSGYDLHFSQNDRDIIYRTNLVTSLENPIEIAAGVEEWLTVYNQRPNA